MKKNFIKDYDTIKNQNENSYKINLNFRNFLDIIQPQTSKFEAKVC